MSDPVANVRLRAARQLWSDHGASHQAEELAVALRGSTDPRTRIALARRIGPQAAHDLLLDTASDGRVPAALRIAALRLLDPSRPSLGANHGFVERLEGLVATTSGALLEAVVEAFIAIDSLPRLELLVHRFRSVRGSARRALMSLIISHGPRATPQLCELLGFDNHEARRMVIEALGRVGRPEALDHLSPLSSSLSRDLKRAAKDAAAAIVVRHGAAPLGGLSLSSSGAGGQLSTSPTSGSPSGALTVPGDPTRDPTSAS